MLNLHLVNLLYLAAAVLFIFDLQMLGHPRTAVRGNYVGVLGMALAVAATLLSDRFDWTYIVIGVAVGTVIGSQLGVRFAIEAKPVLLRAIIFVAVVASCVAAFLRSRG